MTETAGVHNASVAFFILCTCIVFAVTIDKLITAMILLRMIPKSVMAWLPSQSLSVLEFRSVFSKHVLEFVLLTQRAPPRRPLDVEPVSAHLEAVRWSVLPNKKLAIDVVGQASNCRVFINVAQSALDRYISTLSVNPATRSGGRSGSTTNTQPLLLSDQLVAEPILLNACLWASDNHTISVSGSVSIAIANESAIDTITVIISSQSHTEITLLEGVSLSVVFQLLHSHATNTFTEVKGIFTQSDSAECLVCYERPPNIVLLPCRHSSMCKHCLDQLREPKCIVCRHQFNEYIHVDR